MAYTAVCRVRMFDLKLPVCRMDEQNEQASASMLEQEGPAFS
jgi:hypothetical protein